MTTVDDRDGRWSLPPRDLSCPGWHQRGQENLFDASCSDIQLDVFEKPGCRVFGTRTLARCMCQMDRPASGIDVVLVLIAVVRMREVRCCN